MQSPRIPDWRSHLAAHIEANRSRPFEWGEHDCGLWAFSAHEVVTGVDLSGPFRGKYTTAAGAAKVLRKHGFAGVDELMLNRLGGRKPITFAKAGDIVAVDLGRIGIGDDGLSVGVCFGSLSYFVGEDGLTALETLSLEHAYG